MMSLCSIDEDQEMDLCHNEDVVYAFFFLLKSHFLELSFYSNLFTCPFHGCVKKVLKVGFQCYFECEIESSFKVWGCESTFCGLNEYVSMTEGLFSCVSHEKRFSVIFSCCNTLQICNMYPQIEIVKL